MTTWNSIQHQVTDAAVESDKKKLKKYTLWNSGDCEETHTDTHVITYALYTHDRTHT
jgi:hypothetical protein